MKIGHYISMIDRAHARDEVVNKPSERDGKEIDPVTSNDEPIWDPSVAHRILFVM